MDSELLCEVVQGIERVAGVEPFLVLAVAAFHLAVVARCIRTNELMPDAKFGSRLFKQRRQVTPAGGETIGELKAVVRLDTFHLYVSAGVPRPQLPQEICRGVCRLFRVSGEKAQAGELVDSSVLKQAKLRPPFGLVWCDNSTITHETLFFMSFYSLVQYVL